MNLQVGMGLAAISVAILVRVQQFLLYHGLHLEKSFPAIWEFRIADTKNALTKLKPSPNDVPSRQEKKKSFNFAGFCLDVKSKTWTSL